MYIQIAEFSLTLEKSHLWGSHNKSKGKGKGTSSSNSHYVEGRRAFFRSTIINVTCWFMVYIGTTILFYKLSCPLDERASSIVIGFSQIFAGIVFLMMSIHIPQWFGIYHSPKEIKRNNISLARSGKEIQFHVSCKLWNHLISMLFFNLYFCGADTGWMGGLRKCRHTIIS